MTGIDDTFSLVVRQQGGQWGTGDSGAQCLLHGVVLRERCAHCVSGACLSDRHPGGPRRR